MKNYDFYEKVLVGCAIFIAHNKKYLITSTEPMIRFVEKTKMIAILLAIILIIFHGYKRLVCHFYNIFIETISQHLL